MAHYESMNFIEFQQRFPDNDACESYLFEAQRPHCFNCPKCEAVIKASPVTYAEPTQKHIKF